MVMGYARGLLVGALLVWASGVSAQADGQAQGGADQEARALFMAAQVAFDEGRFESAVEYFTRAYELSRRPELLYNIGNTYDRLQRPESAIDFFSRYLQARPDADNARQVEARVRILRQSLDARQSQPTPHAVDAPTAQTAVPTPQQAAQAQMTATQQSSTTQAPAAATEADSSSGSGWLLWTGIGAAVVAATIVTVVIASGGSTTQDPLVPRDGAPVVRL